MKKLPALFIFISILSSCQKKETVTSAPLGVATGSCVIGKWSDSSLPLNIKMSDEFQSDFSAADEITGLTPFEQMAKVWNTATTTNKTFMTTPFPVTTLTGYATPTEYRDNEIGIYKANTWFPGVTSSALAITQFYGIVTSSTGLGQYISLTHADIIFNYDDYGDRMTIPTDTTYTFDFRTILLHEMGHLLGLCHESVETSIMDPYYNGTQRTLYDYDKKLINEIYVTGTINALKAKNTNALSVPEGTEVSGIIELHADGKCSHYIQGKKIYEHQVDINRFKRKK